MKVLVASLLLAAACGGPQAKPDDPIVKGADVPPACCCKTIPLTDDKEIQPAYAMTGRMECSTQNGTCVDAVQCNGSQATAGTDTSTGTPIDTSTGTSTTSTSTDTGVPPPPDLPTGGGSGDTGVPPPPNL